ncbi:hypothetical protein [Geothrix sp.]|jgi:hypothetical protein|uniref:hypothetical protein n=1 Tax=Geothrix sp. TaxID=1962974 RepID=UPI0025C10DB6|nr:hypothetical protein [Geothrix sp.]
MKPAALAVLSTALWALPVSAQGSSRTQVETLLEVDHRAQAEVLVEEAATVLRASGLEKLVHEINHANGRFASKDASKPQLIVYDLKGQILAYAGDPRHIGMNHGKVMAPFLAHIQSLRKGWYTLSTQAGMTGTRIYFEKVGDALITATLRLH